jgi:hypothetical protein
MGLEVAMTRREVKRVIAAMLATAAGTLAGPASADLGNTRIPRANYDAFVQVCRTRALSPATCDCMARKTIAIGREGEIAIDAMGLYARNLTDDAARHREVVALLGRYGITAEQAQAAIAKADAGADEVARSCT